MVLESLISPFAAEKKPWELFFLGGLYASVAIFISIQIFQSMAGLIAVFLTVIACVPLIYNMLKLEEEKDTMGYSEATLLKEHSKALLFLLFLFLGIVFSFTAWYTLLPSNISASLFEIQINTIKNINSNAILGHLSAFSLFSKIFLNNIKVLIFCILFSFFYGAGAIFILTWNASVVAVAIGTFIKKNLLALGASTGVGTITGYVSAVSAGFTRYLIHGIPEIAAYFIGGLAGGIISVAIIKHDFKTENFERVVVDSADLILVAVLCLFGAALIEVFITPALF